MSVQLSKWCWWIPILLSVNVWGQNSFPNNWMGHWEGSLLIYQGSGETMELTMNLDIVNSSDSSWQWKITYLTDSTKDERNYTLHQKSDSPHYILDENNGILLYLSSLGNGLYSSFEVMGTELLITYELNEDRIIFRSFASGSPSTSGGQSKDIPEVVYRKTLNTQYAKLSRKD